MPDALRDALLLAYPWITAAHVASVIAWMAGLFYLPRLFVYHAERAAPGSELDGTFQVMEGKLLRLIMRPALLATWAFGLLLAAMGGLDLAGAGWGWVKLGAVLAMTAFHGWLAARTRDFALARNGRSGRAYRLANEVPTLLMLLIVVMVIVKPF